MNLTDIDLACSPASGNLQRSMGKERYHVGLFAGALAGWGGGRDLLRYLALGLSEANMQITLVIPGQTLRQHASYLKHDLLRRIKNLIHRDTASSPPPLIGDLPIVEYLRQTGCAFDVVHTPASSARTAEVLQRRNIDVLLPADCLGRDFPVRWVGYIPDLQHKHLPHFFSRKMIDGRDREFSGMVARARWVLVNSRDTKRDVERHYPSSTCKIFALPFSPLLEPEWLKADPQQAREKYRLTRPFFLISNQFWVHKDHGTAIRALALLDDQNVDLVCTGDSFDWRAPEHFASLQRLVEELRLGGRVKFVGRLPKLDQIALMRGSVAVLQPTLFEGGPGGGSVYNAVALGVPAIVSDLPINREIEDDQVSFFACGSAQALAERMQTALRTRPAPVPQEILLARSAAWKKRLGAAMLQLVEYALAPD